MQDVPLADLLLSTLLCISLLGLRAANANNMEGVPEGAILLQETSLEDGCLGRVLQWHGIVKACLPPPTFVVRQLLSQSEGAVRNVP